MHIYQVGGAVRDRLLNRKYHDIDYVITGATEEELIKQGYEKVGHAFPVFLHPKTKAEYALARKEIKTGLGHSDFKFIFTPDISLKEDHLRRDFTCNALYYDETTDTIIDYCHGQEDIKNHILRHVSEHFIEDPLRVLRMCRFSASLNFSVAPETMKLCQTMVKQKALTHLDKTRIWQEIERALKSENAYRFITTARDCGALQEIFPELENLFNIPERLDYHPEGNSGAHTLLALKAAKSSDSYVNYAILLHDIGKNKTDAKFWPSHHNHEILGLPLIKEIGKRINAPKAYTNFALFASEYHMVYRDFNHADKISLVQFAILLDKHSKENYFSKFKEVIIADVKGRESISLKESLKDIKDFCQMIEKILACIKQKKVSDIKNFSSLQEKIKVNNLSYDILKTAYIEEIIKDIKL